MKELLDQIKQCAKDLEDNSTQKPFTVGYNTIGYDFYCIENRLNDADPNVIFGISKKLENMVKSGGYNMAVIINNDEQKKEYEDNGFQIFTTFNNIAYPSVIHNKEWVKYIPDDEIKECIMFIGGGVIKRSDYIYNPYRPLTK